MNMTLSNTDGMLNAKQVGVLLNWDPYVFPKVWQDTPGVLTPDEGSGHPYWTTAQVREMRGVVLPPEGVRQRKRPMLAWTDSEMLSAKICGELHDPPIKLRSFFANLARKRSRLRDGYEVEGGVPEPDRRVLGHPVWAPETLRDYLANRPGPGNHKTKAEGRNGYTGGRVPGTKVRRTRTAPPELVEAG